MAGNERAANECLPAGHRKHQSRGLFGGGVGTGSRVAWERAEGHGRVADLTLLQRPIDHRGWGQSSWVNYWQGRDDELWIGAGADGAPAIWGRTPVAERQ